MPITFNFDPPNNPAVKTAGEAAVFGGPLADDYIYADLAGDLMRNGSVHVFFNRYYARKGKDYPITIYAKLGTHNTWVRLDHGEFNYSECSTVTKDNQLGRLVMLKVAKTAKAQSFQTIDADAIRGGVPPAWGYSVYPIYGFDQDIPANIVLPQNLSHFTRVLAPNLDPTGRAWWKLNGDRLPHLVFDLTDASPSWERLRCFSVPY
jgi:hypothetical protein